MAHGGTADTVPAVRRHAPNYLDRDEGDDSVSWPCRADARDETVRGVGGAVAGYRARACDRAGAPDGHPQRRGDAERQLRSFYVLAFHLRDALIEEASTTGIPEGVVKAAVRNDPALALLADLANLDKHGKLNDPPKSGHAPRLGEARGASSLEAPGWRLDLVIEHAGRQLDGVQVAADAVEAWRRVLAGWRLIPPS